MKPKATVTIYSRPTCHLCEVAKSAMQAANCADAYTLEEINIETDPDLLQRYKNDIPVVAINGIEAFRHRVNPEEFRRRLLSS